MTDTGIMRATPIREIEGYKGQAILYKMDPPVQHGDDSYEYVIASSAPRMMWTKPETLIFPSNAEGEINGYHSLGGGSYLNQPQALDTIGYEIQPAE
jgi:hypothetical protein